MFYNILNLLTMMTPPNHTRAREPDKDDPIHFRAILTRRQVAELESRKVMKGYSTNGAFLAGELDLPA